MKLKETTDAVKECPPCKIDYSSKHWEETSKCMEKAQELMLEAEKSEKAEGEIIAERKSGYKLNGRVIQAAKVVVSGKGAKPRET